MDSKQHFAIATAGFLLSPLSWWNDLVINLPLAYAFASVIAFLDRSFFLAALVIGYWLTNLAGILLMHYGAAGLSNKPVQLSRSKLIKQLALVFLYTLLMAGLVQLGILQFPAEYLKG